MNAIEEFSTLGPADQARVLVRLSWHLTLVARWYYVPQSDQITDASAVREINEIQHRVSAHAFGLLHDPPEQYADGFSIHWVWDENPGREELSRLLRRAFVDALRDVRRTAIATVGD